MCEPAHSIVQAPDEDEKGPTQPRLEAAAPSGKRVWLNKIRRWFHLSRMGTGHMDALRYVTFDRRPTRQMMPHFTKMGWIETCKNSTQTVSASFVKCQNSYYIQPSATSSSSDWLTPTLIYHVPAVAAPSPPIIAPTPARLKDRLAMPAFTSYEAFWWERKVVRDGEFYGIKEDLEGALEAAKAYAYRTSIGNLSILRRFLESSIRQTNNVGMYVTNFLDKFLTHEGRSECAEHLRRAGLLLLEKSKEAPASDRERLIRSLLGFTRRRKLIVPEWADVVSLWMPGQQQGSGVCPVSPREIWLPAS